MAATAARTTSAAPPRRSERAAASRVAPVVTTSSTTRTQRPAALGCTRKRGPDSRSRRLRPVCASVAPSRSSSRRQGSPRWAATPRASSSAWSKPRRRRRGPLVGAQVTTSTSAARPARRRGEKPGDVGDGEASVLILEPEQHVADAPAVGGGDNDPVRRARRRTSDQREPARAAQRRPTGLTSGTASGEDHAPTMNEGCHRSGAAAAAGSRPLGPRARCSRRASFACDGETPSGGGEERLQLGGPRRGNLCAAASPISLSRR